MDAQITEDFFKHATLDVIIPHSSHADIEILRRHVRTTDSRSGVLPSDAIRTSVFYGQHRLMCISFDNGLLIPDA